MFSPIFSKDDFNILKDLGKNEKIITCPPDKSRGVVIMNKADYVNKMNATLADLTKFQKMPNDDPFIVTVHLEDRINRLFSKLKSLGTISEEKYIYIYAAGTAPGVLNGLAKTHKPGIPLRPILAAYKTTMFKLGKFLIPILEPFTVNEYTLKNSYHFYKDLNDFKPRAGNFMVSFGVSSLYTNVPVTETIAILLDRIFKDTDSFYGFDRINFSEFFEK